MTAQESSTIKMLLDVREVAAALGCGRTYVYDLIKRGELSVIKLDRLTRVPTSELQEFVARKQAGRPSVVPEDHLVHGVRPVTRQRHDSFRRRST